MPCLSAEQEKLDLLSLDSCGCQFCLGFALALKYVCFRSLQGKNEKNSLPELYFVKNEQAWEYFWEYVPLKTAADLCKLAW